MDAIIEKPASLGKQVGASIRRFRKHRGLTLRQVADAIGTSAQTVSRLETDDMKLSMHWLERVSAVLQVEPYELLASGSGAALEEAINARIAAEARLYKLRSAFASFCQVIEESYGKELGR